MCNNGYRLSVTWLIPQSSYREVPLRPYAMRRQADVTGRAPEDRREKGRQACSVFLHGAWSQRSDPRCAWYGQFAGILQGELRQRVSRVRMLMSVAGEGTRRSRLARPMVQSADEATPQALPQPPSCSAGGVW